MGNELWGFDVIRGGRGRGHQLGAFSVTDHIWQQQPQVSLPPGVIILTHHDHHHGFPQGQFGILENVGTGSVLGIAGGYEDHENSGVHQGPSHQIC